MEQVSTKKMIISDIALLFVAMFWGSNFVVTKEALNLITPFAYLAIRFTISGLIMAAIYWKRMALLKREELMPGILLGFLLFAGFGVQIIGLILTTPAKSGFITGTSVVIVPFLYLDQQNLAALVGNRRGLSWPWGLFLLSFEGQANGLAPGEGRCSNLHRGGYFRGACCFTWHLCRATSWSWLHGKCSLRSVQFWVAFLTEPLQRMFIYPLDIWRPYFTQLSSAPSALL